MRFEKRPDRSTRKNQECEGRDPEDQSEPSPKRKERLSSLPKPRGGRRSCTREDDKRCIAWGCPPWSGHGVRRRLWGSCARGQIAWPRLPGQLRVSQSEILECGIDILHLGLCRLFQRLVALETVRTPGLDEKAIGISDLGLRRIRSKPQNLQGLATGTVCVLIIKQPAARTEIHFARWPSPLPQFGDGIIIAEVFLSERCSGAPEYCHSALEVRNP